MEVTLREFAEADTEALFSWASDPRVVRFQRREAYSRVDEARRYILDHVLPHPWYRAICVGSVVVGSISIKPGPAEEGGSRRRSPSSTGTWSCSAPSTRIGGTSPWRPMGSRSRMIWKGSRSLSLSRNVLRAAVASKHLYSER